MNEHVKKNRVGMINLGCARNLVDAQVLLAQYKNQGHEIVKDVSQAEKVIVNTCGFIEEAKKESIDAILELLEWKKKGKIKEIVVAGCLSQRYFEILKNEFKDVDSIQGVLPLDKDRIPDQISLTPRHYAYIKICESCYNQCSFCAIPAIKGSFVSRRIESVIEEVKRLDQKYMKELNIVGQDITAYGIDLYKKKKLSELLQMMLRECQHIEWIRLLYTFPAHITDALLDIVATEEKICKYIDVPFQHINERILKVMNRNITKKETYHLIDKIRSKIPDVAIRSAFIVGLPGETEEEFRELCDFIKDVQFEKVGAFKYSSEEGTVAHTMKDQVPEAVKNERLDQLMLLQKEISLHRQEKYIGRVFKVLIEEDQEEDAGIDRLKTDVSSKDKIFIGRSQYDAPDVDGAVYVYAQKELPLGEFVNVKITTAYEYDLAGEIV